MTAPTITPEMIEAGARRLCIAEGYRDPDEDWRYFTNGEHNTVVPDIHLPPEMAHRWCGYAWKVKAIYAAMESARLEGEEAARQERMKARQL